MTFHTKSLKTIKKLLASFIAICFAITLFVTPAAHAQETPNAYFVSLHEPGESQAIPEGEWHIHIYNEGCGYQAVRLSDCDVRRTTMTPYSSFVTECEGDDISVTLRKQTDFDECTSDHSHVELLWHTHDAH